MYERAIKAAGLEITRRQINMHGETVITAEAETNRGELSITYWPNGTACIDKPNGHHKWYYEKTPAQIYSILKQTIDCNK